MNPRNPVNGATYLTLGILSLVLCLPLAWAMSSNALRTLDRYEPQSGDYSQRGMVVAGRVCAIIGTIFFCFAACALLARGCAQPNSGASSYGGSGNTTVTVDGKPVTGEEKEGVLRQIRSFPPQPLRSPVTPASR